MFVEHSDGLQVGELNDLLVNLVFVHFAVSVELVDECLLLQVVFRLSKVVLTRVERSSRRTLASISFLGRVQ